MLDNVPTGKYGKYVPLVQTIIDMIIVGGSFVALSAILHLDKNDITQSAADVYQLRSLLIVVISCGLSCRWLYSRHCHRMTRAERMLGDAFLCGAAITVLDAALVTFTGYAGVPLLFFLYLLLSVGGLLFIAWIIESRLLKAFRMLGRNTRNVVIIGTTKSAQRLAEIIMTGRGYGMVIHGHFDDKQHSGFTGKYLGDLDRLEDFIQNKDIDEIYFAASLDDASIINKVIYIADQHFCKLYFVPLMSPRLQYRFYMQNLDDTIPAIAVHPTPLRRIPNRALKRGFDVIFSAVFLLCSPVIFVPIAIGIKATSKGPVFFRQQRTGYLGKTFYCYKFRTMRQSSDADTRQASKNDSRKTRFGNFLRHTSLDELPQFWNVLKGDMSIVGPRPHMLAHTEEYRKLIDRYMVRHIVKPGITGWAQILGFRGATEELSMMENRVKADTWYIEHWSFSLDLKIIFRTVTNALRGESNAY